MKTNRTLIRQYISILLTHGYSYDSIEIKYFIILHNYLFLEEKLYRAEIKLANKEIDKYLYIKDTDDIEVIKNTFLELYDIYSIIRTNVETLDSIDEIYYYIQLNPNIFNTLIDE